MKKNTLLSFVSLLGLVLSLDACSLEDDVSNIEESSEDTTSQITDTFNLDEATNPGQLFLKAANAGNYSMIIEYDTWKSTSPISYSDYLALSYGYATDEQWESYYNLFYSMYLDTSYLIYLFYDTDYVLVYCYQYNEDASSGGYTLDLYYIEILLNLDDGTFWNYTYMYDYWSYGYYYYDWQTYYYSLFDITLYDVDSIYDFYSYGTYNGVSCEAYTLSNYLTILGANGYLFAMLGAEWTFGSSAITYGNSYYDHYLTYFFEDSQECVSNYYADGLYTINSNNDVSYIDEELFFTLYDVGQTDESEFVYYIHNAFQDLIYS